jgi:predicted outer membrane lipoprotein
MNPTFEAIVLGVILAFSVFNAMVLVRTEDTLRSIFKWMR